MTLFDPQVVAVVGLLALITNALVESWLAPLKLKMPDLDTWWAVYVSWVLAGALVAVLQINLFALMFPQSPLVGIILTALVAGRGSNFLADLTSFFKKGTPSLPIVNG